MWMDVKYEPGTLKVIAFDQNGNVKAEKEIRTAGKPSQIVLSADRDQLKANGEDLKCPALVEAIKLGLKNLKMRSLQLY